MSLSQSRSLATACGSDSIRQVAAGVVHITLIALSFKLHSDVCQGPAATTFQVCPGMCHDPAAKPEF